MRAVRNFLLDVDGTLVDTGGIFYGSLNRTLEEFGYPRTREPKLFGQTAEQTLSCLGIREREEFARVWLERFRAGRVVFFPQVVEALAHMHRRGVDSILVSSRNQDALAPIRYSREIGGFLRGAVGYEDTERHKPDPEPLLYAMKRYGLSPDDTIFVGDTQADAQAAEAAGLRFYLAGWSPYVDRSLPGTLLERPEQLVRLPPPRPGW